MREHQIVITLKPDQFLEVQRLARAANAKSMGIYVRQKLLSALGIEVGSTAAAAGTKDEAPDIEPVIGQIRRLHSELKTFVAESLSLYNVDSSGDPQYSASAPKQSAGMLAASASDSLENVAERTFAISPRLGSIGADFEDAERPAAQRTGSESGGQTLLPGIRHEYHQRSSPRNHQGYGAETAQNPKKPQPIVEDPLDKLLPKDEEFKPVSQSKLLQQPSFAGQSSLDDALVPPSLAERKRQLATNSGLPLEDEPTGTVSREQAPLINEDAAQAAPEAALGDVAADDPVSEVYSDDAATATSGQGQSEAKPVVARPPGYPSLSGSPPPKRRQL